MKHAINAIRAAIKPVAANLTSHRENRENSEWYDKQAKDCARQIEALTKQMQLHATTRDGFTAQADACEARIAELESAIAKLESG